MAIKSAKNKGQLGVLPLKKKHLYYIHVFSGGIAKEKTEKEGCKISSSDQGTAIAISNAQEICVYTKISPSAVRQGWKRGSRVPTHHCLTAFY